MTKPTPSELTPQLLRQWLRHHNYDVGIRYYPIARRIRRLNPSRSWKILDVGSGLTGISPFLPGWNVVGIDRTIPEEDACRIPLFAGSATHLPFCDRSWDAVTCVDVLEHVSPAERGPILAELLRVARNLVVVACPFGKRARDADRRMADAYAAMASAPPDWVSEHLRYPYPQISELEMHLEKLRDNAFRMEYRYVFNEHLILQRVHRYLARVFLPGYKACGYRIAYIGRFGRVRLRCMLGEAPSLTFICLENLERMITFDVPIAAKMLDVVDVIEK